MLIDKLQERPVTEAEIDPFTGVPRAQRSEHASIPTVPASVPPGQADADMWHYAKGEKRHGPISTEAIMQMFEKGELERQDHVWQKGWSEWRPIDQTPLIAATSVPPPLSGAAVGSKLVWVLAFLPLIFCVFEKSSQMPQMPIADYGTKLVWCNIFFNFILCSVDWHNLKMAGYSNRAMGWMWLLVPVYLFKRSRLLKHKYSYFIVWIIAFLISLSN
jgi:GYF domain 2